MRLLARAFGPMFVLAGANHFINPRVYLRIMPPWLPAPKAMNLASGAAEIAGGAALMCRDPRVRRAGGWLSILTLVAVFPANIHMAGHPEEFPEVPGGAPALRARLPLQALFIAWAAAAMR
ncbi:unannotated protein [freshwater metagenome]|uniref:Unannotated protein n=1 Tax=freshwater metagenome TaxID=449393 RepID=A0A6J7HGT3_9ZZZZ|nr:hypothetical protein [Actinomycetota bacterium]